MISPIKSWRKRGGRRIDLVLSFADIMEVALALLSLSPDELASFEWSFEDRKRLLDYLLASGKQAQRVNRANLDQEQLNLRLPVRDIRRLQHFVRRELPKAASNAGVIARLGAALDAVLPPVA